VVYQLKSKVSGTSP